MRYSILISIFFSVNFLFSQSYYNRILGEELHSNSAKSMAMGENSLADNSSSLLLFNPSILSKFKKGISFDFSSLLSSYNERRGFVMLDNFDGYLAESDYVSNNSLDGYFSGGISYLMNLSKINLGFGISYRNYISSNYSYEEEVRGRLFSYEGYTDGVPTIRDYYLGYHVLDSEGVIDLVTNTYSIAYNIKDNLSISIGLSYNKTIEDSIIERVYIDTLAAQIDDGLSTISYPYQNKYNTLETDFLSFGIGLFTDKIECSYSQVQGHKIETTVAPIDVVLEDYIYNHSGDAYTLQYLYLFYSNNRENRFIERPFIHKLDFKYSNQSFNNKTSLLLSYSQRHYSNQYLNNAQSFNIGIEYKKINKMPYRFGVFYQESPIYFISPITGITAGTSIPFYNFILDIGCKYSTYSYKYIDLFQVDGDIRPELDTINETMFKLLIGIKYEF